MIGREQGNQWPSCANMKHSISFKPRHSYCLVYLLRYKLRTYTLLGHKFSSGGTLHKSLVLINQPEYPPECMSMSNIGLAISFSSSPSSPSPSPFFYSPWAVGLYQAYTILFSFGPHKHVIFQR